MSDNKPPFPNKLVAVLNKSIEPGRLMNALAHMSLGLGSAIGQAPLLLCQYTDANNGLHPNISAIPFIILRENSNKIRALRQQAIEHNIQFTDFTETMIEGTYKDQLERTAKIKEADLVYYGITLFGDWEKLTELTKKFSLWR